MTVSYKHIQALTQIVIYLQRQQVQLVITAAHLQLQHCGECGGSLQDANR